MACAEARSGGAAAARLRERLAEAADGILDEDEQALLNRAEVAGARDLPLLDEARALLRGRTTTYGHVIVDEAQDLTPMQLRMISGA